MQHNTLNKFGRTDLSVSALSFGAAPIGNIFREISEETSDSMINHAYESGINYYDTAPMYGHGLSELRLGHSLRWKERDSIVMSSKVGRVLTAAKKQNINYAPWVNAGRFTMNFDYSYDGTIRSIEDSLQRLNLEQIEIVFIHDIDVFTHGNQQPSMFNQAMDGAWKALESLRQQGLVKAIGVGVNEWEVCQAALEQRDFDCFLLAGRYTLLEQESLKTFLPMCEARNVAVVIGGGFNSGILATGAIEGAKYNYTKAPQQIMDKVTKMEAICADYDIPLPAAAMQFITAHPAIPSLTVGTRTTEQLQKNIDWFSHPIPAEFWSRLKHEGLLSEEAPVPE